MGLPPSLDDLFVVCVSGSRRGEGGEQVYFGCCYLAPAPYQEFHMLWLSLTCDVLISYPRVHSPPVRLWALNPKANSPYPHSTFANVHMQAGYSGDLFSILLHSSSLIKKHITYRRGAFSTLKVQQPVPSPESLPLGGEGR